MAGDQFEGTECAREFAGSGPERTRVGPDFAQGADREEPAGSQSFDEGRIQTPIAKLVADQDIYLITGRQAGVQIDDVEAAAFGDPATLCKVTRGADGHGRHVEALDCHTAASQPHGDGAAAACDIQGSTVSGEHIGERPELRGKRDFIGADRLQTGVAPVPTDPIRFGHYASLGRADS